MKVFILLVLSIGVCQASPLGDDVDCDDPEVFEAVDRAIKSLNTDSNQRNKFALNVILHAYRTAGKKFHVIYQVRETLCPVAADDPWQRCEFLDILEGHSGNCTANVDINDPLEFFSVSQSCNIRTVGLLSAEENITKSLANCLGCWHPIDPKSLELLPIVRFTIRQLNNESQNLALYEVGEIRKATRKVVNGWNYQLEHTIKETNCSKNEFPELSPACRPLPGGQEALCTVNAHIDNANTLAYAEQECKAQVNEKVEPPLRVCPGCPISIPADNPELKEVLEATIESFNAKNHNDSYFKIVTVRKATKQVVAGIMYRFHLILQKTNCSKAEVEKLHEDCTAAEDAESLLCFGSVYVKPWESLISPEVICSNELIPQMAILRVPPGFTPFRSTGPQIRGKKAAEEPHLDQRGGHIREKGRGHGHRRRKGHKHGHKKPRESSSEEVTVPPPAQAPRQLPTSEPLLEQEANRRSLLEENAGFSEVSPTRSSSTYYHAFVDYLPDLPEPPKCPGTPWKPKRDSEPRDTSFSDFDLLDALQK